MNEAITEAIVQIDKAAYAVLITVGEENIPNAREIGPFVNDGLDVYFVTRADSRKVKEFSANPVVTLYFPNTHLDPKEFKSLAITGTAARITDDTDISLVLDELGRKSPYYRKFIDQEGLTVWAVFKLTAKSLQLTDYSKPARTVKTEV